MASENPDYSEDDNQIACYYDGATGSAASNQDDKDENKYNVSNYERAPQQPIYNQYVIDKLENLNFGGDTVHPEASTNNQEETKADGSEFQSITKHQKISASTIKPKKKLFQKFVNLGKGTTSDLKLKLQHFYSKATLPCIPWLNKGRDLVMSEYYTELQLDTSDVKIPLENIFKNIDKKNPRILIEGQPGYGKTTLATKLVYDWALSKSYIKHFKLVFLIPLRELQRRNVISVIADIARRCGYSDIDKINEKIRKNMSRTLLVFDGLDELPVKERLPILEILYGQEFVDATVIVTSRTGLFTLQHDEETILSAGLSKIKEYYDRRVDVLGIQIEDRESFLLKFVSPNTTSIIMESIKQLSESATIMFGSPLFLILLAFMASKTRNLTSLRTKTQFFKRLFNYLVNHSMKKKANRLDEEIDLFQIDLPINEVQKTVQKFGELSLYHIRANKLQFEHNKLTTKVYNMGFLINHKEISTFESTSNYEAFHLTILEFAAAFSIWIDFKQKEKRNPFECILPLYLELNHTSLILPFLGGLLQEDVTELFRHLSPHAHIISAQYRTVWHLLTDFEEDSNPNSLLPILTEFIPPHIQTTDETLSSFYASQLYSKILKFGIQSGRVKLIRVAYKTFVNLPRDILIPTLFVYVETYPNIILSDCLNNVKCEKMIVEFNSSLVISNSDSSDIFGLFHYLSALTSKSLSIKMSSDIEAEEEPKYSLDCFTNIQFDTFTTEIHHDLEMQIVSNLLLKNQIKTLRLDSLKQTLRFIPDLINNFSKLNSLYLNRQADVQIDLHDLIKGGEKQYHSLSLKVDKVVCKQPMANKKCIYHLNMTDSSCEILDEINPTILECNASAIDRLSTSWTGYLELKELSVEFDKPLNEVQFWRNLSRCKNLTTFELTIDSHRSPPELREREIVTCLQELPIETFVILDHSLRKETARMLVERVVTSLLDLTTTKLISVIFSLGDFHENSIENVRSTIKTLLDFLKLNKLKSLYVIVNSFSTRKYLIEEQIIDYSLFSLSYEKYGSLSSDPICKRILYDINPQSQYHSYNIYFEV